jgi:mRNA-degrading endonuclease toxin of MazEF toxin-antitoxin module
MNKGEIYLFNLFGRGNEQRGIRPVIIYSEIVGNVICVIPLTSSRNSLKRKFVVKIDKTDFNGLSEDSIALIFQIKSLDSRDFGKKIGKLNKEDLGLIDNKVKEFLKL